MDFKKIVSELKRRNVIKVATAYAITGWLIIQIVTAIKEPLSLPNWFDTGIIILVLIVFPIALIIAWAFELTPQGLKKTEDVRIEESTTKDTGKRLNRIIIAVLLVLIAFLIYDRFSNNKTEIIDAMEVVDNSPSIAVLPFTDLSPQKDQEYFSDGLSEELLNVLAKVKEMKVAGRTSSFKFKGQNDDLKKIGKELGVKHILEGSVRKSGNKIRVTAQLIKVEDGFHMWSETYDKEYNASNLFEIQDEISKEVLSQLKITLLKDSGDKKIVLTISTEAYEAYLKGNQLLVNRDANEIKQAINEFKKAIALDSEFGNAYAKLAIAYYHIFAYGSFDSNEATKGMQANALQAIVLDNKSGLAHAALSHYYSRIFEREKAFNAMKKAYELAPNNAEIVMWYAKEIGYDQIDLKLKLHKEAYDKDPLSPIVIMNMMMVSNTINDNEKALFYAKENVRLNPTFIGGRTALIRFLKTDPNGKLDEAFIESYKLYKEFPSNLEAMGALANNAESLRIYAVSDTLYKRIIRLYPETPYKYFYKMEIAQRTNDIKAHNRAYIELNNSYIDTDLMSTKRKYSTQAQNKFFEGNYEEAYRLYVKAFPNLESDTIQINTIDRSWYFPNIILILKKLGRTKKANQLISLLEKEYATEYQFGGDFKKEPWIGLNNLRRIYILKEDYKNLAALIEHQYFVKKNKEYYGRLFTVDIMAGMDFNNKYITELYSRIDKDIEKYRLNALYFLKQQGAIKN